jgi:hypothetical protein
MITPKLISACYAVRAIIPFVSQDILKMMYHSYFHSVMKYGRIGKNGRILFDRPKPTAGCSASGRRRR